MKVLIALLVIWSLLLPYASAAGHAARGRDLMPHLRAIEDRVFNGPSGVQAELGALQTEYAALPEGDRKDALAVVLKAVSANPSASAHVLFSDHLDREVAAAAGRITRGIRKSLPGNEPLARTLDSIHDQLWHGEEHLHWGNVFDGEAKLPVAELPKADIIRTLPSAQPGGQLLRIKVSGAETMTPPRKADLVGPIVDHHVYDTVIVGAGYSGLTAAWWLRDKDILLIDREVSPGGIAYQGQTKASHVTYARGAAYITKPEDEVKEIYDSVGLTEIEKIAIKEPIDSYWYKGELIKDPWAEESLKRLPPGWSKFKADLERMDAEDVFDFDLPQDIPEQSKYLDSMTAKKFLEPYGPELTEFLDSYAQSALGGHLDQISALGFLLFYSSEIVTRYTWPGGTGGGSKIMAQKLWATHHHMFRTRSTVREVRSVEMPGAPDGMGYEITYERDGKLRIVRAKTVVSAVPLKVAARIVPEMPEAKRRLIAGIQYADYVVHSIFTSKDLYKGGYDTWFPSGRFSMTDVIAGRWLETEGYTVAHTGPGILTVYMPMAPPVPGVMTNEQMADLAARAAMELRELVPGLAEEKQLAIESYRWPSSIHLTPPGYLTQLALQFATPDGRNGRIFYAGNNLSLPGYESSLVSGKRAAEAARKALEIPSKR